MGRPDKALTLIRDPEFKALVPVSSRVIAAASKSTPQSARARA